MAILFDSADYEPRDRADAFVTLVQAASAPSHVRWSDSSGPPRARLEAWQFGRAGLLRIRMPEVQGIRTSKLIRKAPVPAVEFGVQLSGALRHEQAGVQHAVACGQLFTVDLNVPYDSGYSADGSTAMLYVPYDDLDLPLDIIRRGAVRPELSPLSSLVTHQITRMSASADALSADSAARELGDACVEMARALLLSAANAGCGESAAVPAQILLSQIRDHVRRNLKDPDLGPAGIARAHGLSRRYLYKLCAGAGFSLEQWIIEQRLARAATDLTRPEHAHRPIGSLAQQWGFRDPSHFARRFRAAYGMTPREWRRMTPEERGPRGRPLND